MCDRVSEEFVLYSTLNLKGSYHPKDLSKESTVVSSKDGLKPYFFRRKLPLPSKNNFKKQVLEPEKKPQESEHFQRKRKLSEEGNKVEYLKKKRISLEGQLEEIDKIRKEYLRRAESLLPVMESTRKRINATTDKINTTEEDYKSTIEEISTEDEEEQNKEAEEEKDPLNKDSNNKD